MPWCHECEKEFEEGLEKCPDCGAELYENIPPSMMEPAKPEWNFKGPLSRKERDRRPKWPKGENGEPETPKFLTKVNGTQLDYEMTARMLEAFGVPTLRSLSSLGRLGRLVLGFSGTGTDIYVPESRYEEAKALLESSGDDDEEE